MFSKAETLVTDMSVHVYVHLCHLFDFSKIESYWLSSYFWFYSIYFVFYELSYSSYLLLFFPFLRIIWFHPRLILWLTLLNFFKLKYVWTPFASNPLPLLYLGLFTTGVCNYLQTIGQKDIPAERAAIIYSMDPVYAGKYRAVFCCGGVCCILLFCIALYWIGLDWIGLSCITLYSILNHLPSSIVSLLPTIHPMSFPANNQLIFLCLVILFWSILFQHFFPIFFLEKNLDLKAILVRH